MVKHNPNLAVRQRSFDGFLEQAKEKDKRPHPLIVSEKWQFPLTYVDTDNDPDNYLYCARDWYIGLGGHKSTWSESKSDWLAAAEPVMIETKRERRAPEMLEYVDQHALYLIAQRMRPTKEKPAIGEIQSYLAAAGVFVGQLASGSKKATRIAKRMISEARQTGIDERKNFTATIKAKHEKHKPQYGLVSNAIYSKVFKLGDEYTAKKHIVAILGLDAKQAKDLRGNLNELAQSAVTMAEKAAIRAMNNRAGLLNDAEIMQIVKQCARIVSVSAWELAEFAGVDLVTDKPLLGKGR